MKLYVFLVNTGTTLTFDTELTVQTVADLKHAIQSKYKIAIQHQVLVVNGGECMAADRRVCTYSAGTDTNPIFLFNKEMILCDRAPAIPKATFSTENDMELKVEESLMMPAVFHTVASRTQLAVISINFTCSHELCAFVMVPGVKNPFQESISFLCPDPSEESSPKAAEALRDNSSSVIKLESQY